MRVMGTVFDYDSIGIKVLWGERRIELSFASHDQYQDAIKAGLGRGRQILFDPEKSTAEKVSFN